MLTRTLTAFVLAAIPQVPTPRCTLAGPPVEARWSPGSLSLSTYALDASSRISTGFPR